MIREAFRDMRPALRSLRHVTLDHLEYTLGLLKECDDLIEIGQLTLGINRNVAFLRGRS